MASIVDVPSVADFGRAEDNAAFAMIDEEIQVPRGSDEGLLGKVFKTIQEVAARMRAAPDTDRHAVAIRANRAFYQDFLAPRVAAAAKLHS